MLENRMVKDSEWESMEPPEREFCPCERCGREIYFEDALEEGDPAYNIDGFIYCEDCIGDVARDLFRVKLFSRDCWH